jgi:excisionase family DNA binding protein
MVTENGERLTMTVCEVAHILGISKNSAYLAVRRGELPCIKCGARRLIPRAALDKLLQGNYQPSSSD